MWLDQIGLYTLSGAEDMGRGVHFGNFPFENFISFQKGHLLIYIILVLIFFLFTPEMTSLLSSIL